MKTQKVTAHLPVGLLKDAMAFTGDGITETLRAGLDQLAHARAYEKTLALRGTYRSTVDVQALREDR